MASFASGASASAQEALGDPSGNDSAPYWDKWFTDVSSGKAFEWYCKPGELLAFMGEVFPPSSVLLHAGTGNSELVFDAVGKYPRAVCMDVSSVAIAEMKEKKASKLPACENIQFAVGDVLEPMVSLRDFVGGASFDGVVDKGLMDAMMSSFDEEYQINTDKLFRNVHEVMRSGRYYLCVTLAEEHLVRLFLLVLDSKNGSGDWMWSKLSIRPISSSSSSGSLRPFVFFLEKGTSDPTTTFDGRDVDRDFDTINGLIEDSRKAYLQVAEKKQSVPMTMVTLEIKPYEADFDFDALLSRLTDAESSPISSFGAMVKSHELVPLAFGIRKLELIVVGPTENVKNMCEAVLEREEEDVQSVDVDWTRAVPVMDAGRLFKSAVGATVFIPVSTK